MLFQVSSWFDKWLYCKFDAIRLHRVNYFSIWFILIFSILFSLLVIHEEYKQFRSTSAKQREVYIQKEYGLMRTTAHQIEKILTFLRSSEQADRAEPFNELISAFNENHYQFVILFDAKMHFLAESIEADTKALETFELPHEVITEAWINIAGTQENVLLLKRHVGEHYNVIVGHYLQPFHEQMAKQKNELKKRLIRLVLEVATLSFILFGFIWLFLKIFNELLERDVRRFLNFFAHFKEHYKTIPANEPFFAEFKSMAQSANEMVQTIASQKQELEELNRTLEERVERKTLLLQQLLESQKRFIRYAIHETNTPLSVIMTNIELYSMKRGRDEYLAKIEASVKQIFNIYDDLSYLVKKDLIEYPKLQIDLQEYVKSRIRFFEEVAAVMTLSFEFESSCHKIPYIHFNETKLQRIIDNNLTNAIKYTRRNKVIHVRITCKLDSATLSFSSHSIPIKDTEKIFEAYYRESQYRDGFGLGLNLVKSICDEEGVTIRLDSNEELTQFQYRFILENATS